MSINEIRRELDLEATDDGDAHFVQVNLQTLERATSSNPDNTNTIKEKIE
jgi:hypothetical protein